MFSSEKKKAIKALNDQKALLDDPQHTNDWTWVSHTSEIVKKYLGVNSNLYRSISGFDFSVWHLSGKTPDMVKQEAKNLIDSSIKYINDHGVLKEPKVAVVPIIKANWLVALYFVLTPAIFTFGGWWKYNFTYKEEIQNLQKQIEFKNDTIRVLRDSSPR